MLIKANYLYLIKSFSSENLFTKLKKYSIKVEYINKIDEFTYQICISIFENKKLKKAFPDARIINKNGFIFHIKNILIKKVTIVSLLIGIIGFIYLNTLIYSVEIYGNDPKITEKIVDYLNENDIKRFKKKPTNDYILELKEKIVEVCPAIENVDIILKGNILKLTYFLQENKVDTIKPNGKFYAKKNGLIAYTYIEKGNCPFRMNDYVKQGQLLIDDYLYKDDKQLYVGAYGKVFAYTWSIVEFEITNNNLEDAEIYSFMLDKSRYQISCNFTNEEYIVNEKILEFNILDDKSNIRIHYTLLENIATMYL